MLLNTLLMIVAEAIDHEIKSVTDWAKQWLVNFSPPKSRTMTISKNRNSPAKPLLSMGTPV